jgi:integrase
LFKHLSEFFDSGCLARNITADRVERYKSHRLSRQAKPATINRELAFLRRGFRLAVRRGCLAVRPDFSLLRENNARRGFITEKQMEAIRAAMPEDLRGLVTFLFYSGWRVGEALSLEWSRVDRDTGVIRLEMGETKTGEARTLPYGALSELRKVIDSQCARREALQRQHRAFTPFVFFRERKREIKQRARKASPIRRVLHIDFLEAWQAAVNAAGVPGRIPHDLRRSAARNMLQAGIPQRLAMALGGWKTSSVFHRYGIVDETMLRDALAKLSKASTPS